MANTRIKAQTVPEQAFTLMLKVGSKLVHEYTGPAAEAGRKLALLRRHGFTVKVEHAQSQVQGS